MERSPGQARRIAYAALATAVLSVAAARVEAQGADLVTAPPHVILPNANGVPPGQTASLEGGAYVARADDSSSNWYNPAGLARASTSSLSATGGAFQLTTVTMSVLPDSGRSFQHLPTVVGALFKPQKGRSAWTFGFAIIQFNSWDDSIATQLLIPQPVSPERFGYTGASQFWRIQGGVAAAHDSSSWRYGFALATEFTSYEKDQTASDIFQTATGALSFLGSSHFSGSATHLRVTAGVQRDLSKAWKLGASVRLPGVEIYTSGVATIDGLRSATSPNVSAYLFAPNARFKYKVPAQGAIGLAYVGPRFEAELTVRASAGQPAYHIFSSDAPVTVVTDDGRGGPPANQTSAWAGITSDPRGYVDASFGGHATLTENGVWRLHFGLASNQAPVTNQDEAFSAVNLYAATIGIGGQLKHLQASLGLRYEYGKSSDVLVQELASGQLITTTFSVRNVGIIYSLAYLF